jgi:hypothetical protein
VATAWTERVFTDSAYGALRRVSYGDRYVYFEKIRVLKAGVTRPNNVAWNNGIGPRFYFVGLRSFEVMINRDRRGDSYCGARGEILGPSQDELKRKHFTRMFSLIKNES